MSSRPRFVAATLLALSLALSGAAQAQTDPAKRADQLNEEGKQLFGKNDFAGAAQKFRQAILFSPEGRFYFNLCFVLDKMGKYREALTACEAVAPNGASNPLKEKTDKVIATDRQTAVVVDLTEQIAGKAALQRAAAEIAERLLPKLVGK